MVPRMEPRPSATKWARHIGIVLKIPFDSPTPTRQRCSKLLGSQFQVCFAHTRRCVAQAFQNETHHASANPAIALSWRTACQGRNFPTGLLSSSSGADSAERRRAPHRRLLMQRSRLLHFRRHPQRVVLVQPASPTLAGQACVFPRCCRHR